MTLDDPAANSHYGPWYPIRTGALAGVLFAPLLSLCGAILSSSVAELTVSDAVAFLWYLPGAYVYTVLMSIPFAAPIGAFGGFLLHLRLRQPGSHTRLLVEAACAGSILTATPTSVLWWLAPVHGHCGIPVCAAVVGAAAAVAVTTTVRARMSGGAGH